MNQASGSATATARAADKAAMESEAMSALRHPASVNRSPYHASDRPCGGNSSAFFAFSETPATITSGAARNSAMAAK